MTDPRKIRIRYEIDVTLDQSEYATLGATADEAMAEILNRRTSYGKSRLIAEMNLDLDARLSAEIVK